MTNYSQLLLGDQQTITQNIIYALPARQCFLQSIAAIQTSLDASTWTAIATSTAGAATTAAFVRCTSGDTTIVVKV